MKKKKIILFLLTITAFFSFNINVKAEGYCIYNIPVDQKLFKPEDKTYYSVKLEEDSKGNITYYYANDKQDNKESKDWKKADSTVKFEMDDLISKPLNSCPNYVNYSFDTHNIINIKFTNIFTNIYTPKYNVTPSVNQINSNNTTNNSDSDYTGKIINDEEIETKSCAEMLGDDLINIIQDIINIVKVLVPILLIVFGTLDFGKAIFSSDENKMKEAQSKFMKRVIVAVAFFLIPTFLSVILNAANQVWDNIDPTLCGIIEEN